MDTTAWLIVAAFLMVCVAAWMWLRRSRKDKPPGDDWGGEL